MTSRTSLSASALSKNTYNTDEEMEEDLDRIQELLRSGHNIRKSIAFELNISASSWEEKVKERELQEQLKAEMIR